MAEEQAVFTIRTDSREAGLWFAFLDGILKLPGAKVDRESFLEREFSRFCDKESVDSIIAVGPLKAHVDGDILNKAAEYVISCHSALATGLSFASGLPGGVALVAAIPVDLAQYYYHLAVVAQKLAYIYGWPDMESDDPKGFITMVTVFMGVMAGVVVVNKEAKALSKILEAQTFKRLSYIALAKTGILILAKIAAERIGEKLFWQGYFQTAIKIVPLIGGVAAGGITLINFLPMVKKLKNELKKIAEN
jgi:hypothetical protein